MTKVRNFCFFWDDNNGQHAECEFDRQTLERRRKKFLKDSNKFGISKIFSDMVEIR